MSDFPKTPHGLPPPPASSSFSPSSPGVLPFPPPSSLNYPTPIPSSPSHSVPPSSFHSSHSSQHHPPPSSSSLPPPPTASSSSLLDSFEALTLEAEQSRTARLIQHIADLRNLLHQKIEAHTALQSDHGHLAELLRTSDLRASVLSSLRSAKGADDVFAATERRMREVFQSEGAALFVLDSATHELVSRRGGEDVSAFCAAFVVPCPCSLCPSLVSEREKMWRAKETVSFAHSRSLCLPSFLPSLSLFLSSTFS